MTADTGAVDRILNFAPGLDTIMLAMDGNAHRGGYKGFSRLADHDAPGMQSGFTAGTINLRHDGNATVVEVNASDNTANG